MKKKLLALLLTLCLVLGLFPIGVLAAPAEPGAVEATKTATYDPETDQVTITLSVQGKDVTENVTEEKPVDVVLVVDNSGSMEKVPCSSTVSKIPLAPFTVRKLRNGIGSTHQMVAISYISAAKKLPISDV